MELNPGYVCKFVENGVEYNSVVQYYYSKMSSDIMFITKIMTTDDPEEIVRLSQSYYKRFLKESDDDRYKQMKINWKSSKKIYYIWATYLKFKQNPDIFKKLECSGSTDDTMKKIIEQINSENK